VHRKITARPLIPPRFKCQIQGKHFSEENQVSLSPGAVENLIGLRQGPRGIKGKSWNENPRGLDIVEGRVLPEGGHRGVRGGGISKTCDAGDYAA